MLKGDLLQLLQRTIALSEFLDWILLARFSVVCSLPQLVGMWAVRVMSTLHHPLL